MYCRNAPQHLPGILLRGIYPRKFRYIPHHLGRNAPRQYILELFATKKVK